jgi:hypothetical protein
MVQIVASTVELGDDVGIDTRWAETTRNR